MEGSLQPEILPTCGYMETSRTPVLTRLLGALEPVEREAAWTDFVQAFTQPILAALKSLATDHDVIMDRYAFVLEHLRADDCRRLRAFGDPDSTDFRVWLFVVTRRLALDHYRHRYGRTRGPDAARLNGAPDRAARRRLVDLVAEQIDPSDLSAPSNGRPDQELALGERARTLAAVTDALDPSDRLLLRLRFSEDLSAREIAELMHFPTAAKVYRRIDAVLRGMRLALGRLGLEEVEP